MSGEVWPVEVDWDYATRSVTNLTASIFSDEMNITDYSGIINLTDVSFTNNTQTANAFFSPFSNIWVYTVWGYWIYAIIIVTISIMVFAKTNSIGSTSAVMILLSALALTPYSTETLPPELQMVFYVLCGLGVGGVMYTLFTGRN